MSLFTTIGLGYKFAAQLLTISPASHKGKAVRGGKVGEVGKGGGGGGNHFSFMGLVSASERAELEGEGEKDWT